MFAVVGAVAGFARQVAQAAALVLGFFCARPLGTVLGPRLAAALQAPLLFGTVAATLLVFILVMVVCRHALTALLRRMLDGKNPEHRGKDRFLGALLAAVKVLAIAYVMLCGLTFVEDHVTVAGQRLGLSPRDSVSFALARRYNLFEYTQFRPARDLVDVVRASLDPERAARLKQDPAFQALRKDPRFQKALSDPAMKEALANGDLRTLLRSNAVLQLVQDPLAASRLRAAANAGH